MLKGARHLGWHPRVSPPAAAGKLVGVNRWLYVSAKSAKAPSSVAVIVNTLEHDSQTLAATQATDGGLKRSLLRQAVADCLGLMTTGHGGSTSLFAKEELDFVLADQRLAISVQAGRAWTNNGALLALLSAAADPSVRWLIVMVPFTYKRGAQYLRVVSQLADLLAANGVELDLDGVALVAY